MANRKTKDLRHILRYTSFDNVISDHPSPEAMEAMSAVFEWLSHNSVCAWKVCKDKHYTTNSINDRNIRPFKHDALVIKHDAYEKAWKKLKEKL